MNFLNPTLKKMSLLFSIIFLATACSKDADLLSDYVIAKNGDLESIALLVDDQFFIGNGQTSIIMDVLNNDNFDSSVQVTIVETSTPQNGEVVINADNTLTYTPQRAPSTPEETLAAEETPTTQETVETPVEDSFTYTTEVTTPDNEVSRQEATVTVNNQIIKAFPSAYGGGAKSIGGRGKALAIITSLDRNAALIHHPASGNQDEYYTGGLFKAMQDANVGYIVFNQSGLIELPVQGTAAEFGYDGIPNVNNKTIFGQSAPQGGITITGGMFKINGEGSNSSNLTIRYIRSRPLKDKSGVVSLEDDAHTWGLRISGGENVIVDHCSFSFAQDKALGAVSPGINGRLKNLTLSNNLIAESHTGYFVAISATDSGVENTIDKISILRNMAVGVNRTPNLAFSGVAEVINNISFAAPAKFSTIMHGLKLNQINNYYNTTSSAYGFNRVLSYIDAPDDPRIYAAGNILTGPNKNIQPGDDQKGTWKDETSSGAVPLPSYYMVGTPHDFNSLSFDPIPAAELIDELVRGKDVGATKYLDNDGKVQTYIDSFDAKMYSYVQGNSSYAFHERSNWVLPNTPKNTRPDNYDTDHDGMADAWEIREFGNLNQSYRGDFDGDGYDNIEEYMNQVDFN